MRKPPPKRRLTLVGEHSTVFPNSPLLVGEEPWQLSQTAILAAIRLVGMHHFLPRWQVKALHRDLVLSVRCHVLTSNYWINPKQWYVILYVHVRLPGLPAVARTDASVMCGATCCALPDPHRLATTSLPRLHLVECAQYQVAQAIGPVFDVGGLVDHVILAAFLVGHVA